MCYEDIPVISHYIIEIGAYLVALIIIWTAWKRGRYLLLTLLLGMIYGFILEALNMKAFHAYTYGQFLIMLPGDLPLAVGVSWGLFIFAIMQTIGKLGLVWWVRPFLGALMGLMLDLGLDPVASNYATCMWDWSAKEHGILFGVPPDNFYGWFFIVFGFYLMWLLAERHLQPENRGVGQQILILLGVLVASLVVLFTAITIFELLYNVVGIPMMVMLGVVIVAAVVVLLRFGHPLTRDNPPDWPILLVPIYFYLYEIMAGLVWIHNPAMLLNTFLWTAVGLFFFSLPYTKTLFRR